jgi:hypothetical protein
MDNSTGITKTPVWRGKGVRDVSPIPSTAKIDTTGSVIEARIDELFKVIPTKGGISKEMVNSIKTEIIKIVGDTSSKGAVEATVSPSAGSRTYSAGEITDVVAAVVKELVPVMSKTLRENSTGYGSARSHGEYDTLAKSFPLRAWKGPSDRAWEVVRMDLKNAARTHECLGIIDGTWTEPRETDSDYDKWRQANTKALILLSNMFTEFKASKKIVTLFTEEGSLDGNAYECWMESDAEFDDDGVYDRIVFEEVYDDFEMQAHWSPSRFVSYLNYLRKKLKRVGIDKDDEMFQYDLIKKLPIEYKDVCKAMQKALRPREIMTISRPRPSDEEIDEEHPLLSLKEVKDMLRTEWEWERKAMRKKKGKPPGKGSGKE